MTFRKGRLLKQTLRLKNSLVMKKPAAWRIHENGTRFRDTHFHLTWPPQVNNLAYLLKAKKMPLGDW